MTTTPPPMPEALRLAELFSRHEADHAPNGWPAIQQRELTYAAITLRAQHERITALEADRKMLREALKRARIDSLNMSIADQQFITAALEATHD